MSAIFRSRNSWSREHNLECQKNRQTSSPVFGPRDRGFRHAAAMGMLVMAVSLPGWGQGSGDDLEAQAGKFAAEGNYQESARLYELLAKQQPRSISAWVNLGVAYAKLEQFPLAVKAYRSALAIDPNSLPALINLGLAEFKSRKFEDAVQPLETALKLDPGQRQAQTLLAMSYFSLRRFEPAAHQFESLFQADPNNTMVQYLLGECFFRSHQQQRLEALIQEVSKGSPNSAALHMLAGEAYDRLNRTIEAILEFRAAVQADPRLPRIHFYLGYLHWEKKEYTEAAREFEAELASPSGEQAQAEGYLGDIAMRGGDVQRAKELSTRALLNDKSVRIAQINLGILAADLKQWAAAERHFQAAIALDSSATDAYYRLARVYRAQGQIAKQNAMLSKVRQINDAKRLSVERVLSESAR